MKKIAKKVVALVSAGLITFSGVACQEVLIGGDYSDMTSIRVFNYNGGVGNEWLVKVAERFEKDYANATHFEEGKTGVKIEIDAAKTSSIENALSGSSNDVVFCEIANYAGIAGVSTLDISELIKTPLNQVLSGKTDDARSIEDKLYDETKDFLTYKDGSYYALPHYAVFSAMVYNKKLFDNNKLYFKDYTVTSGMEIYDYFISSASDTKSCGPDGVKGNEDDGLPATWDEMWLLCDYMVELGIKPFCAKGHGQYMHYLLNNVYLNLAGKEQARYNYTFDSKGEKINVVTGFDGNNQPTVEQRVLDPNDPNGQGVNRNLNAQLEKFQAMEILDKLLDNKAYQSPEIDNLDIQQLETQQNYIYSANESKGYAMLIEGSYWYNEAKDAGFFDDAVLRFTEEGFNSKNDFQVMPIPRVYKGTAKDIEGTSVGKSVIGDQNDCIAVINKSVEQNPAKEKLAKEFLAYCYTDESLEEFTQITNVTRSLKYEVDETKLTNYGKSVWNFTKNSDIVLPYSSHMMYFNDRATWSMHIANHFWHDSTSSIVGKLKGASKDKSAASVFKEFMAKV